MVKVNQTIGETGAGGQKVIFLSNFSELNSLSKSLQPHNQNQFRPVTQFLPPENYVLKSQISLGSQPVQNNFDMFSLCRFMQVGKDWNGIFDNLSNF